MKKIDKLHTKILRDNINLHDKQAILYEDLHVEIFNKSEQLRIWKEISNLIKEYQDKSNLKLLDIGCGTGNLTLKFSKIYYGVYGIDVSKNSLKRLKEKNNKIKIVLSSAETIPFKNNTFDIVSGYSILHHLPNPKKCFQESLSVCKSNGKIYFDHEPLKRGLFHNFYQYLQFKINGLYVKLKGIKDPKFKYKYADYHVPSGLVPEKLIIQEKIYNLKIEKYFTNMIPIPNLLSKFLNLIKIRGDTFLIKCNKK